MTPRPAKPKPRRKPVRTRTLSLPLLDPLRDPFRPVYVTGCLPRIWVPGVTERLPVRPPPSDNDPVSAARLTLRLAALGRALDDLPGYAKRFARWRARVAEGARDKKPNHGRFRRVWPLRLGRLPGWRRKHTHEVYEVLAHTQQLALWALEAPDTS